MNYTPEMEKGLGQTRGTNMAEYAQKLETRMEVEKQREQEYKRTKQLNAELDNLISK